MDVNIVENIKGYFQMYIGDGWYFCAFLFAFGYFVCDINDQKISYLYKYLIGIIAFIFFPITAYIVIKYGMGDGVYWRMFWLIPYALIIAYAIVKIITAYKKKAWNIISIILVIYLLIMGGNYMYTEELFQKAPNRHKLPEAVVPICDFISSNSPENERRLAAPAELVSYVRQYDASIQMPYGREAVYWNDGFDDDYAYSLYHHMTNPESSAKAITDMAISSRCKYLVLSKLDMRNSEMYTTQYVPLAEINDYVVYYNENVYVN